MYYRLDKIDMAALGLVPKEAIGLDLSRLDLGQVPQAQLLKFLGAIPASITGLDLSFNYFQKKTTAEIIEILKAIPPHVTSLRFGGCELGNRPIADLIEILKAIPQNIQYLDLSYNGFGHIKDDAEFHAVFEAISKKLKVLFLTHNYLGYKTVAVLIKALKALSPMLLDLGLKKNSLSLLNSDPLFDALLTEVTENLRSIDLSDNGFERLRPTLLLQKMLANAGESIRRIHVGAEDQMDLRNALSEKKFFLTGNGSEAEWSAEALQAIIPVEPLQTIIKAYLQPNPMPFFLSSLSKQRLVCDNQAEIPGTTLLTSPVGGS